MKVLSIRVVGVGLISLLVGGVIGCSPTGWLNLAWSSPPTSAIREIPQKKSDRIIYLKGKVVDRVPFIDSGSYQLQDATGTVWILTNKGLPAIGEEITIKGQIEYQPIPIGRQDIGEFYILELEKLTAANEAPTSPAPLPNPTPALPSQPQPAPATAPSPPSSPTPKPTPSPSPSPAVQPIPVVPPSPTPSPSPSPTAQPTPIVIPVPIAPTEPKPTPAPKPSPVTKPSDQPQPQPTPVKPSTKPNFDDRYFPHKRNSK